MSDLTTTTAAMTKAAADFLAGLTPEQRSKASLSFDDGRERRRWFYTPTPRPGLPLQEMTPIQQQSVRRLLASGLSRAGYTYAATIIGLEYLVDYSPGLPRPHLRRPARHARARPPQLLRGRLRHTGRPESGWSWRIGGHHLSLHFTLHDGAISSTPAFFGAEPARSPMPGGALLRPLAAEEDLARELLWLAAARPARPRGHLAGRPHRHRADQPSARERRLTAARGRRRARRSAAPRRAGLDAAARRAAALHLGAEGAAGRRDG